MPRHSAKAQIVEESGLAAELVRPDPPAELIEEEAIEWCRVVNSMPADHFIPANHHLLVQLCRNIVAARQLGRYTVMFRSHRDVEHVRLYHDLCRTLADQTTVIQVLSRSMRLTQQSTFIKPDVDLKKIAKQQAVASSAVSVAAPPVAAEQLEMETTW